VTDALARVRPKGSTTTDLHNALIVLGTERAAAEQRHRDAMQARAGLLLTGSTPELKAAEESIREAELDVMRLDAMRPELQRMLTDATAREQAAAREAQFREAADLIEKFNAWVAAEYVKHAKALARGMAMERDALAAIAALRSPTTAALPEGLPALARAHVRSSAQAFGFLVRLPSAEPGSAPHWWP
jgi:hypothetical protein